jgi:glycyl-tRNA synthetase beta chain
MRTHQKYFALRDPKSGKMANRFALAANMIAQDGGKQIVAGNERVLRARLSDAKFFWDQDRKTKLAERVEALKGIVFHAKLGTQYERVARIEALATRIASRIGADPVTAERAGHLCKADLTSGVVGEFPELQGVMGRYYALHDGEDAAVADAIRDHYKPAGPGDAVPASKASIAVALADKLDQLAGFFAIDEKPTGSSDPYALRRAALGIIRTLIEKDIRLGLRELFVWAGASQEIANELLSFFADRLKVALKEKGIRHDLIDAVFSLGNEDDLVRLVARVEALQTFLKTDDGANLLAGYKRAANILKAEEKKGDSFTGAADAALLREPAEISLAEALAKAETAIAPALEKEEFADAMRVMAGLRLPVDGFFDAVKVNADDAKLRVNRLNLLGSLRALLHSVADFSKIEN